jgi:hypothetical protein
MAIKREKHGLANSPEYYAWQQVIQRCTNPKAKKYPSYGGRGITVCERWTNSFSAFLADMGFRPTSLHTLDRKDNNGNYEPGNCRWATRKEQQANLRSNRILTFNGESHHLAEWSRRIGIGRQALEKRLNRGMALEQALSKPIQKKRRRDLCSSTS